MVSQCIMELLYITGNTRVGYSVVCFLPYTPKFWHYFLIFPTRYDLPLKGQIFHILRNSYSSSLLTFFSIFLALYYVLFVAWPWWGLLSKTEASSIKNKIKKASTAPFSNKANLSWKSVQWKTVNQYSERLLDCQRLICIISKNGKHLFYLP